MKQVLIIGNGFDLACGLKSSYSDFFDWRFKKLFGQSMDIRYVLETLLSPALEGNYIYPNIYPDEVIDYFHKIKSNLGLSTLTRWDCMFLLAEDCLTADNKKLQWQDVENIIYNVISIALKIKDFKTNLEFKDREEFGKHAEQFFNKYVNKISQVRIAKAENIAAELLNSLYNFEAIFAEFINDACGDGNSNQAYGNHAEHLFVSLLRDKINYKIPRNLSIEVLSFNYTLQHFKKFLNDMNDIDIKVNSWRNIHGVAFYKNNNEKSANTNAPIFGIDNHDILSDNITNDLRIMFTKAYRLIDNNVNNIENNANYSDADIITIYGHSLGRADYSYFETIFDENRLYDSKTKLQVYYYAKNSENNIESKHTCIKAVVNLLNNYGQTLSDTHGENIVNKMIMENRLEVIPSSNLV